MTYYLKGGEIVEARVASNSAEIASAKLHWLGVQVYKARDGGVMGQIIIDPSQLPPLEGVRVDRVQRFKVLGEDRLSFVTPSPLARCAPVNFMDAQSHADLENRVATAWQRVVAQAKVTLETARSLAQNAHLLLDPWRIEGTVEVGQDEVRVLFSAAGDRACVCGLNSRALVVQPLGPRVIIPVQSEAPDFEQQGLWRAAIEQARTCLSNQTPALPEETSLSLDLASQDLESSYGPLAGLNLAAPEILGVGTQPPPRMPPPRLVTPPPARPPFPPFSSANADSLDLASLDLDSIDLPD